MKITYINETVKLPTKQNKQVSLDDIFVVNKDYLKHLREQVRNIVNEEFKNAGNTQVKYEHDNDITSNDLKVFCLYYSDPLDFSPGISVKEDPVNIGKYVVYLCVANETIQYMQQRYCMSLNKFLNDICDKHSDKITDIRLVNVDIDSIGSTELDPHLNIDDLSKVSFPKYIWHDKIYSDFIIPLSSNITDDQYNGITDYAQRFDDVAESVNGILAIDKNMTTSNYTDVLKKVMNDVLPKFKFKFNMISVDDREIVQTTDLESTLKKNDFLDAFNQQNILKIAYDFDKFYVALSSKMTYACIINNAKLYTQREIKVIHNIFHKNFVNVYIRAQQKFAFTKYRYVGFGYYPKSNEICFIRKSNNGKVLSPEKMFISFGNVLNYIIDNANDPDAVTNTEITNGLTKLL